MAVLPDQTALLDFDYLQINYHDAGFSYLLPEILELFRSQAGLYLNSIEHYLAHADLHALTLEAHTLKGAAGSVGAAALALAAQQLEETTVDSGIAEVSRQVDALRELTARTDAALTTEIARLVTATEDDLGRP